MVGCSARVLKGMRARLFSLVVLAAALSAPAPLSAQAEWEDSLSVEILIAHDCVVAFLSRIVEREVNGVPTVMTKVHCEDQRTFDAQRLSPHERFTFSRCDDNDATTC